LEPTQGPCDWSLDDDVGDACLHLALVVMAMVLAVQDQLALDGHPSSWHLHTVHDLHASKPRHTNDHLDHACFHNDFLSQN